jgi:hypothetical protein
MGFRPRPVTKNSSSTTGAPLVGNRASAAPKREQGVPRPPGALSAGPAPNRSFPPIFTDTVSISWDGDGKCQRQHTAHPSQTLMLFIN